MGSTPKAPAPTAEQKALERRQRMMLDDEIEETEDRLKALARGQLGRQSLLGGVPASASAAARRSSSGRGGGMLGGGGSGGRGGGGSSSPSSSFSGSHASSTRRK